MDTGAISPTGKALSQFPTPQQTRGFQALHPPPWQPGYPWGRYGIAVREGQKALDTLFDLRAPPNQWDGNNPVSGPNWSFFS